MCMGDLNIELFFGLFDYSISKGFLFRIVNELLFFRAATKKCNNWEHPDKYGHYREAKYCQTKHHWLWKVMLW